MLKKMLGLGILALTLCGCFTTIGVEDEDYGYGNVPVYYNGGFYDYNMGFIWLPQINYEYGRNSIVSRPRRYVIHPRTVAPPRLYLYQHQVPLPPPRYNRERIAPPPPSQHQDSSPGVRQDNHSAPPSSQGRSSQGNDTGHSSSRPNNSSRSEGRSR